MEEDDNTQTIVLKVPGFSREDITVSRKRPAEQLLVVGKSKRRGGGQFRREYKLTDPTSTVTAQCAHGLLTIRVTTPIVAPFHVPVSADALLYIFSSGDDKDAAADEKLTVMRRAVPGASAADFKVEVSPRGILTASGECKLGHGRRSFSFSASSLSSPDEGMCGN